MGWELRVWAATFQRRQTLGVRPVQNGPRSFTNNHESSRLSSNRPEMGRSLASLSVWRTCTAIACSASSVHPLSKQRRKGKAHQSGNKSRDGNLAKDAAIDVDGIHRQWNDLWSIAPSPPTPVSLAIAADKSFAIAIPKNHDPITVLTRCLGDNVETIDSPMGDVQSSPVVCSRIPKQQPGHCHHTAAIGCVLCSIP